MLSTVTHLGDIYSNQPFGIDQAAIVWLNIFSAMIYAGPAIVGLVYLMMREKKPSFEAGLPEERPEELVEERRDKAA